VRAVGSTPTVLVDSIKKARHFKRDTSRDQYEIEFSDGRHINFNWNRQSYPATGVRLQERKICSVICWIAVGFRQVYWPVCELQNDARVLWNLYFVTVCSISFLNGLLSIYL
jgi:hypothetical protein